MRKRSVAARAGGALATIAAELRTGPSKMQWAMTLAVSKMCIFRIALCVLHVGTYFIFLHVAVGRTVGLLPLEVARLQAM